LYILGILVAMPIIMKKKRIYNQKNTSYMIQTNPAFMNKLNAAINNLITLNSSIPYDIIHYQLSFYWGF